MRRARGRAAALAEVASRLEPWPTLWQQALPEFGAKKQGLQGAATTWAWDVDELRARLRHGQQRQGSAKVDALVPRKPEENFVSQWKSTKIPMRADDALAQVAGDKGQGRDGSLLVEKMQLRLDPAVFWREHELLPDLFYAEDGADGIDVAFDNSFVWVTAPGLRTSLHSDEDDGFLFHLAGRKRVVLIPPSSSDKDPRRLKALMQYRWRTGSHDDLFNDAMRPRVKRLHVDLEPGDILYIPKRWLHDVESLDATVSLAVRFHFRA